MTAATRRASRRAVPGSSARDVTRRRHDLARRDPDPDLEDLAATRFAEIHIDVRRLAALLGNETLEQEVAGRRIDGAHGDRKGLKLGLLLTILLGLLFTSIQAYEYAHAPFAFKGSIYGSTFFMATGFHGFHVIVGTIFLTVCLIRSYKGDFTPRQHFGFEAAAWYWHFVDVVWLFLFTSIYVWGGWGAPVHG